MPHVTLPKALLYQRLELPADYDEEKFGDLCFEFGVEVEELRINEDSGVAEFHIEIPANRYDLLCLEGFARAFRFFMGLEQAPIPYTYVPGPVQMVIKESVKAVRPLVQCAVLRNITFTDASLRSFLDLQEKLHSNICRKRSLVSIGTHDLDKIVGPFSYEGCEPHSFKFITLRGNEVVDGHGMMEELSKDEAIKEYLPLIRDKSHYPVIFDSNRTVLSVPPIINGNVSKMTTETKNVFIEVTGIDPTKTKIVLDIMCLLFSEYSNYTIEQVTVLDEATGQAQITPQWVERQVDCTVEYFARNIGVPLIPDQVPLYLHKLQIRAVLSEDQKTVTSYVSPIRPDIFHPCDLMEDVAIGFGFSKLLDVAKPPPTVAAGKQIPINQFSDDIRAQCALAGWSEVMTFSLCSEANNFSDLNHKDDNTAVIVSNPKGKDFQNIRVTLFPGLLNVVKHSKQVALPLRIFEVSDVCYLDPKSDVGASNKRCLCAFYVNKSSAFEIIHGLLDRVMQVQDILHKEAFETWKQAVAAGTVEGGINYNKYYWIENSEDPIYFSGTCGKIFVLDTRTSERLTIGTLGIIHPTVLEKFKIAQPISAFHIDLEPLLAIQ